MRIFEIVRTKDLQDFYIIAENPLDAMQKHRKNLDRLHKDEEALLFNTGYSYVLKHNNDVYCLTYRIKK